MSNFFQSGCTILHSPHEWRKVLDAQCSGWHLVLSTEWTSQDADLITWEWFDVFLLLLGWRSLHVLEDLAWPCCLLSSFLWLYTLHSRPPSLPLASISRCFLLPWSPLPWIIYPDLCWVNAFSTFTSQLQYPSSAKFPDPPTYMWATWWAFS